MKLKFFGNEEKMRKQQLELVSMLNRWYQVKEDLLFAFEKCGESDIGEPTKTYIRDFVARIKGGMGVENALDFFAASYPNKEFRNFVMQIRFNMRYRGNTADLLDNLETQFGRIDEELTRRKIESSRDRLYLYGIFIAAPVAAAAVLFGNPSARALFFGGSSGALLCAAAGACYGIGLLIYLLSSQQKT